MAAEGHHEDGDEPELWVLDDDDEDDVHVPPPPARGPQVELRPTLTSDDVAGDDWADTAWLDELASPATADEAAEAAATGRARPTSGGATTDQPPANSQPDAPAPRGPQTTAAEFASLREDVGPSRAATRPPAPQPAAEPAQARPEDAGQPTARPRRRRPDSRNPEVAEFLRELSRLALEDD